MTNQRQSAHTFVRTYRSSAQGAWAVAFAQDRIGLSTAILGGIAGCMGAAYLSVQPARDLHEEVGSDIMTLSLPACVQCRTVCRVGCTTVSPFIVVVREY